MGAAAVGALAPAVGLYGLVFGVLASAKGLSSLEAALFSALVNAGGAQFASLSAWAEPPPLLALVLTTLAMNARYVLLGATLHPWMGSLPVHKAAPSLFVMGDGNWALSLREREAGRADAAFLLGSGLLLWVVWVCATSVGHGFGRLVGDPRRFGFDFLLAAFFATMGVSFMRARRDILPFIAGVAAAIIVDRLVPGPWAVLAGAVVGSVVGAAVHVRRA